MLCASTLKFTTLNNVESTSSITSKQRCHFQRRFSQRWSTSKQRCEYDHLKKIKIKYRVKSKVIFLSFKEYTGPKTLLILFSILKRICKSLFGKPQKFLKHRIYWITTTIFKLSHFVKCQLVFNFTIRQFQAHHDYRSFNFINILHGSRRRGGGPWPPHFFAK